MSRRDRTLEEVMEDLSPKVRERAALRTAEILAEIDSLQALRRAMSKTQTELAGKLGVTQASVARTEKRADLLLSTLRQYVEALGGTLSLVAAFPNKPEIHIQGLGDLARPAQASRSHTLPVARNRCAASAPARTDTNAPTRPGSPPSTRSPR